jgi:DNA-binding transcriptional LysR family regulator
MIDEIDPSWQRIELRHLVALYAIEVTGSFRGAALRLGYSISALSEQVAALERLVGQRLVERPGGRRSVTINPAGRRLLEHADEIGDRFVAARADLEAIRLERPLLRLGAFQSPAVRLFPGILRRLKPASPSISIELVERADDGVLLDLLSRGDVDVCFAVLPLGNGPYDVAPLLDDPYLLVVASDGPLGARESVSVAELADFSLIDYREIKPTNHARHRLPPTSRPRISARTDDNMTIHALVAAGVGVALMPHLCIDFRDPAVRAIEIEPMIEPRQIVLVSHVDRRPEGLDDLISAARDEANTISIERTASLSPTGPASLDEQPSIQERERRRR